MKPMNLFLPLSGMVKASESHGNFKNPINSKKFSSSHITIVHLEYREIHSLLGLQLTHHTCPGFQLNALPKENYIDIYKAPRRDEIVIYIPSM